MSGEEFKKKIGEGREELKNKLVGILESIAFEDDDGFPYWLNNWEVEAIAVVLIEQGLKFDTVVSHTATFDRAQQERINELERQLVVVNQRAEVAKKIARRACDMVFSEEINDEYFQDKFMEYKRRNAIREFGITPNALYDYLEDEAKRELAEGGIDGKNFKNAQ